MFESASPSADGSQNRVSEFCFVGLGIGFVAKFRSYIQRLRNVVLELEFAREARPKQSCSAQEPAHSKESLSIDKGLFKLFTLSCFGTASPLQSHHTVGTMADRVGGIKAANLNFCPKVSCTFYRPYPVSRLLCIYLQLR